MVPYRDGKEEYVGLHLLGAFWRYQDWWEEE